MTSQESTSEACSPPLPGLYSTIPQNGEQYPANAAIFVSGYGISLDAVAVTVDGAPASLVHAAPIEALGIATFAVLVSPPPMVGQTVEVKGDFCPPESMCEPQAFTFVATEADISAPPAPSALSFNLYDYPDFKSSGGDCQNDSDLAWWITAAGEPASATESRVLLTIEGFRGADFKDLAFSTSTFLTADAATVSVHQTIGVLNGLAAPDALCIRATTMDAAGNKSAGSASACEPCNYRKDASPATSDWVPAEPEWTAADVFPGGPCDMGSGVGGSGGAGSGGGTSGDVTFGGCGCHIEGNDASMAPSLAFAALAAALLRAARRR